MKALQSISSIARDSNRHDIMAVTGTRESRSCTYNRRFLEFLFLEGMYKTRHLAHKVYKENLATRL
jgi:hypothetical protein